MIDRKDFLPPLEVVSHRPLPQRHYNFTGVFAAE